MNQTVSWAHMRKAMLPEAERLLNQRIGVYSTRAQVRAAALKMVDMAIAQEKRRTKACLN